MKNVETETTLSEAEAQGGYLLRNAKVEGALTKSIPKEQQDPRLLTKANVETDLEDLRKPEPAARNLSKLDVPEAPSEAICDRRLLENVRAKPAPGSQNVHVNVDIETDETDGSSAPGSLDILDTIKKGEEEGARSVVVTPEPTLEELHTKHKRAPVAGKGRE